jgi:hypothetical protein
MDQDMESPLDPTCEFDQKRRRYGFGTPGLGPCSAEDITVLLCSLVAPMGINLSSVHWDWGLGVSRLLDLLACATGVKYLHLNFSENFLFLKTFFFFEEAVERKKSRVDVQQSSHEKVSTRTADYSSIPYS